MRVCCVPNFGLTRAGGRLYTEPHAISFFEELSVALGHVTLCAPELARSPGMNSPGFELANGRGVSASTRKWRADRRLVFYALSVFWLAPIIWRSDFLYVFLPGRLGIVAAALARVMRRPYGVYLRGSCLELFGVKSGLAGAAFVLATGAYLRDVAARSCASSDLVSPMFDLGLQDLQVTRVQRSTASTWRLLYVGALEEAKGTFDLLEAAEILLGRGRSIELTMVGDWVDDVLGQKVRAEKRLGGAVKFAGSVNDRTRVKWHFLESDLLVFPSHTEGFPRVLYEAMCLGLPTITTMVDGIPSLMEPNTNCLGVPVRSPKALADAVEQALDDVTLRERLAAAGLSTMRRVFDETRTSHAEQVAARVRRAIATAP